MKVTIVLPTYNEAENLKPLVAQILDILPQANILITDDNSPDGTGLIADELAKANQQIKVLHRAKKEGLGRAYIEAFKYLFSTDTDYIITMDADFSHDPKYLPQILEVAGRFDAVVGSRYIRGTNVLNWPLSRLILSVLANKYVKALTGLPVNDCTAGFVCYNKEALKKINFKNFASGGYAFQFELKYKLCKRGLSLKEIPIVFIERARGSSKISRAIMLEALFSALRLCFCRLYRRSNED